MEHKGKFDCLLYGHKGVVPALGVSRLPAKCYVLKGSLLSKLLDEEDIVEEGIVEEEEEEGDVEGKAVFKVYFSCWVKTIFKLFNMFSHHFTTFYNI